MDPGAAIDLTYEALFLALTLALPIMAIGMAVGLLISIVQAVTQLQEQTLSFVPKIVGMGVVAILVTPWVTSLLVEFSRRMFAGQ